MDKAELEALVSKVLQEHPAVFPTSRNIANLLKNYEVEVSHNTILRNIDLSAIKLGWIKSCPEEIFLKIHCQKLFKNLDEESRLAVDERFRDIVNKKLEVNPLVFPSSRQISRLFADDGIKVEPSTINKKINLPALHLNWIKSCPEKTFLENLSKNTFNSIDKSNREVANERFKKIIEVELENNPEVFPSSIQIANLLSKKYGLDIGRPTISRILHIAMLQSEWIASCDVKIFLEKNINGTFSGLGLESREAVKDRFVKIIEAELKDQPDILPTSPKIVDLLNKKYQVKITSNPISTRTDLPALQLNWIKSCSEKAFLENLSSGSFSGFNTKLNEAMQTRFAEIVESALPGKMGIFPSSVQISLFLKNKYGVPVTSTTLIKLFDLHPVQMDWINSISEKLFLENFSKSRLTKLDGKCKEAADRRMHDILLSHIDDLASLPLTKTTIIDYIKKFPDLAFILISTQEHKHTIDQRIVLDMQVWKETRSEDLHEFIGERLDQLWGFRELFALMKDGRCLDADVISMFHENLPERIGNYIPESAVTHSFVDNLMAGDFKAREGKDVLLLSFMHWLTDKQSAEIMLRLNQSLGTDNAIYMTSPNGLEYAEDVINSMNTFGFVPEKVGSLYLLPPDESEGGEQKKLLTKGKILQFRKMQDVEKAPEELQLFSKGKRKKGGERAEPKADIISYDEKTLEKSSPLITMKDVGVIFTEEAPKVRKVEVENDKAILTLEGGAVLGFHVEPRHPYSIEVEGKKIPKGMDNAILDVMNGKQGFEVGKGLKRKYNQFLKLIKDKKEQIGSVRKTKLKAKR